MVDVFGVVVQALHLIVSAMNVSVKVDIMKLVLINMVEESAQVSVTIKDLCMNIMYSVFERVATYFV